MASSATSNGPPLVEGILEQSGSPVEFSESSPAATAGDLEPGSKPARARRRRIPVPHLRLTTSERSWALALVDALVLNVALLAALVVWFGYPFSWRTVREAPIYFGILTVLWFVWASFFDCYDLARSADASQSAWSTGRAALLASLTYLVIPYVTPHFPVSRLSSYVFIAMVSLSIPAWRALYATIVSQPDFQQRLLIVGAGVSGAELARELTGTPRSGNPYAGSGYWLIGFIDDDPDKAGTKVEGVPVLGDRHDLSHLVEEWKVDALVVAITHTPEIHPSLLKILLDCREQGVRMEPMTSLFERLTGRVPVGHAAQNLHVVLPQTDQPFMRVFWSAKRVFDVLSAIVGLVVLVIVLPFVALANAVFCPGPLLYRQARVGRGGQVFQMVKFRSMVPGAEESGPAWASSDDPRVTPVGRFLRRVRLDELPQVWNIIRGEMSLVGPRPERPEFVSRLVKIIPFYQARHAILPGITGWAQVRHGYAGSVEDSLVKLQYDLYYIKHQSVYLELSILVKTAAVMLGLRGR